MENIRLRIGKKLRKLRKKQKITQEEFANRADIDYKYMQKIEGKNPPNIKVETLEKLAKAFNVSLSKLLDF
ncbi:MAG: helix-turn-helix domain-containing protein [Nanoarchaeota archaeon]|nr:helix-turn-helix domain-containing protein [Nanoarchaeota archaeon]